MKNDLLRLMQKALNAYLALDPETTNRLRPLQGKIVTIDFGQFPLQFHLFFHEKEITLQSDWTTEDAAPAVFQADTIIRGTPLRLLQMAWSRDGRKQFFADDVSIQGNLELGQQVMDLFDQLEIDWEEMLSHLIGDIPAHQVGNVSRKLQSWMQHTCDTLLQNVNDYVHEEVDFFPARFALQDFFADVDALREDTDRLEARIEQLKNQLSTARGAS